MSISVGVLFGGQSSEHPVSLMSVVSVLKNLSDKYDKYLVGITTDGRWYHYTGSIDNIENGNWQQDENNEEVILSLNTNHHGFYEVKTGSVKHIDVILPILHGRNGEDGTIQGVCQLNGIPCVSCNLTSCAASMDKAITHTLCESSGITMAKSFTYYRGLDTNYAQMFENVKVHLGLPCYVKPTKEGSSFGAHKVTNYEDFVVALDDAYKYDNKILVEEFIEGIEVGCALMGDGSITGEVFEVIVQTEMYGFAEKYDGYKTVINTPALTVPKEDQEEVKRLAKLVYKIMDCDVMARVDFFYNKGRIVFNELNLIPGFTSHSLYPASMQAANKSYQQLLDDLIDLVLKEK